MFKYIQNHLKARRLKKMINAKHIPKLHLDWHADEEIESALTFTGTDGENIFSISANGEAVWYKEDAYNEAAEIFLTYMSIHIEDRAGIIQNRIEWEKRITKALVSEAAAEPLGPEDLTKVIQKCIMVDKLRGIKN